MLTQVRGALKGVVAWFIIALLVLAFAFFGIPDLRNFAQSSALQVGQVKYSSAEVQQEFDRQLDLRRRSGEQITREDAIASGLLTQTLDNLKARAAVSEDATELKLTATNEMIADFLQSLDGLKNPSSGRFDQQILQAILRENNVSITEFREDVRSDLVREQMFSSIASGMRAPESFVEASLLRLAESRNVSFVSITAENIPEIPEPSEEQLRQYYDANAANYTDPEYRVFQSVILSRDDFQGELEVDEEELRQLFEIRKSRFDVPEKRTLIQIPFPSEAEARAAIARLDTGTTLEQLAEEQSFSIDSVTYTDVEQSALTDADIAAAVFAAEEEDIVGPVTDLFGNYVIAKVLSITAGEESTFEEQREALVSELLEDETMRTLLDSLEVIETARDEGATLSEAIQDVPELSITTFGPIDEDFITSEGAILNDLPNEVLREVFLLQEGDESDVVPLTDGNGYFMVSIDEVIPPALQAFESVREDVAKGWRAAEIQKQLVAEQAEIVASLGTGESLEDIASANDLTVETRILGIQEAAAEFPPDIADDLFTARLGGTVSGSSLDQQTAYVLKIEDASFPPLLQADLLQQIYETNAGQMMTQELSEAYIATLQNEIGIKQNDTQLAQIFGLGE